MIFFLTTDDHQYTIDGFIKSPSLEVDVVAKTYSWLFLKQHVPFATYIFTDIDRLAPHELVAAAKIYQQLKRKGIRVINNPAMVRSRAALLHHLYQSGINKFQAYPANSYPRPSQFPVFIKHENHHKHLYKDLINDQQELDSALHALEDEGSPLNNLLVIEFFAKPIRGGIYQKHSEFRVGDAYLPYDSILENNWCAKRGDKHLMTDEERAQTIGIMQTNPYQELLQKIFDIARIEYGRVDFGFVEDQIAIYEINTNPNINLPINSEPKDFTEAFNIVLANLAKSLVPLDSPIQKKIKVFGDKMHGNRVIKGFGRHYRLKRL